MFYEIWGFMILVAVVAFWPVRGKAPFIVGALITLGATLMVYSAMLGWG